MANKYTQIEFDEVYKAVSESLLRIKSEEVEGSVNGIFYTMLEEFRKDFNTGGMSNDQIALAKAQFFSSAFNTLESQANASTLSILESQVKEATIDATVSNLGKEGALIESQKLKTDADKLLTDKEIEIGTAKISLITKDSLLVDSKISLMTKEELLTQSKKELTDREKLGYDDGLRTKEAEFRGQLASFAVNADSAFAQDAIDNFNTAVALITP